MVQLPIVQESAWFSFATELDGAGFTFTWRWNDRAAAWFFDLADSDGGVIATGVKLVVNLPLLVPFHANARCPAGELIAIDTTGQGLDAEFEDLGRRVVVLYASEDEVP